ncbi:MAG: beta-lactamase family protein [Alphaproteobacteria bacterium]|nr:beta-lactamase family protein [Alphaproteobacteria bacterium]
MIPGYARIEAGRSVETRGDARFFQAASLGKMVTAALALRHLDLDAPVATATWTPPFDAADITIRDVLMHRAGLSVPDYPGREPDAPVPTLAQSLDGIGAPGPLRRTGPNGRFAYSGGGYTWLQLAIEETTGRSFDDLVREWDLWANPTGLSCETGHDAAGNSLPFYRYDGAAAGLLATPSAFARFMIDAPLAPLAEATIETGGVDGLWPRYGLGVEIDDGVIGHHGINRGWRALAAFDPVMRDGLVLFANRDGAEAELEDAYRAWRRR